jgi:hypothetical protein
MVPLQTSLVGLLTLGSLLAFVAVVSVSLCTFAITVLQCQLPTSYHDEYFVDYGNGTVSVFKDLTGTRYDAFGEGPDRTGSANIYPNGQKFLGTWPHGYHAWIDSVNWAPPDRTDFPSKNVVLLEPSLLLAKFS